jgi:ATP-dependent DNA helicase RecG
MTKKRALEGPSQLVALLPEADPDSLAETMVAFANADGGTLYVGVDERGRPTGEVYPEDFDVVVHQAEQRCRPPIPVEWQQTEARGGAFVFTGHIRRSPELHALDDGRVLVRTGDENRPLSGDQVRQLATTRSAGDYEAEPVPGAERSDLDEDLLEEFVEKWVERQGRPLTRSLNELLKAQGWLTPKGQPTVAGILLFGKSPQIFVPRSGLTFVRFEGTEMRGEGGAPGYGRRAEVDGPLPRIIKRTWEIIQEEIQVGAVVRDLEREEKWRYPPTAIREALVNAVAHRDYRLRGRAIEVRIFTDRLEVSSPGGLPGFITVDNIIDEHFSRNPRVVNGLFQWGYIEELGLGVDLMIEEMVNAGHEPPQFHETPFSFTVTFRSARPRRPRRGQRLSMNERQAKALDYVQKNGRITNGEYQELCPDVSSETLRLDLVDLVEKGVLLKVGAKRGTYYILK